MHHDQIMESNTPLHNYLSNCVIKLHFKLQSHDLFPPPANSPESASSKPISRQMKRHVLKVDDLTEVSPPLHG
jgi:hypothetical protein